MNLSPNFHLTGLINCHTYISSSECRCNVNVWFNLPKKEYFEWNVKLNQIDKPNF